MRDDFAVFILSHGRANKVKTLKMLEKIGYTGKIYIIIDDEDEQEPIYRTLKCTGVVKFCKKEEMQKTDTADNFNDHKLVVYARNQCHDIARKLKLNYFLVLDDDYDSLDFRYIADDKKFKAKKVKNANKLFTDTIEFLEVSGAITVAYGQSGDYIGGTNGFYYKGLSRKAMNSFFCKTDRPFKFSGSTNEDVNMYITYGNKGYKIFTITRMSIVQTMTQQTSGGLTDIYLQNGTYVKSFYSVIHQPQAAKVAPMGGSHKRIHHKISWNKCTPKILNEKWKK